MSANASLPHEILCLIAKLAGIHTIHNFGQTSGAYLKEAAFLKDSIRKTYTTKAFDAILKSFRSEPDSEEFARLYDRVYEHLKTRFELWRFNVISNEVSLTPKPTDAGMDATQILRACLSLACSTTCKRQDGVTFYDSPSTYNRIMLLGYAFANGICDKPDLYARCRFRNVNAGQKNIRLNFELSANCHTEVHIRYEPKPDGDEDHDKTLHLERSFIHVTFSHANGSLQLWLSYPGKQNKDLLPIYDTFENELTSLKDTLVKCMKITADDKILIDTNWARSVKDFVSWSIGHPGPMNPVAFTNEQTPEKSGSRQTPWKAAVIWVHLLQFIERHQALVDNDTIEAGEERDLVSIAFMRETGYPFATPPAGADGTKRQITLRSSFLDTALFV